MAEISERNSVVPVAAVLKCNEALSQFPVNRTFRVDVAAFTVVRIKVRSVYTAVTSNNNNNAMQGFLVGATVLRLNIGSQNKIS
jgi:hypothetical protein